MASALGERIASLEEQLATIETGAAGGVAPERVATLESDIADLETTVARLQQAGPSAGAAGDQAVADLAARIDAWRDALGRPREPALRLRGLPAGSAPWSSR